MAKTFETKLRKVSNQRPKSLILSIPATIRDMMELEHGTKVTLELSLEQNENIIKIRKKD